MLRDTKLSNTLLFLTLGVVIIVGSTIRFLVIPVKVPDLTRRKVSSVAL